MDWAFVQNEKKYGTAKTYYIDRGQYLLLQSTDLCLERALKILYTA